MAEYPSREQLDRIKTWNVIESGVKPLIEYVRNLWKYGEEYTKLSKGKCHLFKRPCMHLELHTFGWSGNESIVDALDKNVLFWMTCWEQSNRGGHYKFEIPMNLWEIDNGKESC